MLSMCLPTSPIKNPLPGIVGKRNVIRINDASYYSAAALALQNRQRRISVNKIIALDYLSFTAGDESIDSRAVQLQFFFQLGVAAISLIGPVAGGMVTFSLM
jgi:hypothetical protein